MQLWQVLVLAVVQGVTEFLPVSSSGHLVLVASLFPDSGNLDVVEVNIVLHAGTLASILVFYHRKIWELLTTQRRAILIVAAATLPTVIIGLAIRLSAKSLLGSPTLAAAMLLVTGAVLLAGRRFQQGQGEYRALSPRAAFFVGVLQGIAVLPGISRSGTTITAAMALGLSPRSAATFSFLLAIPVIAGAGLLESVAMFKGEGASTALPYLAAGTLMAFLVGLASLWGLVRCLESGKFHWFAWWCIPLGALFLLGRLVF